MQHLQWHKSRLVTLGPKIEGLSNTHPSKPGCLFQLAQLFDSVGNDAERKRLLTQTLVLYREQQDDVRVAHALRFLSDANLQLGLRKEGIQQVEEALGIFKGLNDKQGQALSLQRLARLLYDDGQLGAAEEVASQAIDLLSDESDRFHICESHRILGNIYRSKGETERAIGHFETALEIASPSNWHDELFWIHSDLARLFLGDSRFDDAQAHVADAKSHVVDDAFRLGRVMGLQAAIWCGEGKYEEARSEVLGATAIFKKLGAARELERCGEFLRTIEMRELAGPGEPMRTV